MPAFIRSLALVGALFSSLLISPAFAQDQAASPTTDLPTVTNVPAPAPAPDTMQPAIVPATDTSITMPAPTTEPAATAPAKKSKSSKKKSTHKKSKTVHHSSSKKHKTSKAAKVSKGDSHLRDAQTHLANLTYYKGKVDGVNGPQTRAAIKAFQHDHKLTVTGKLTQQTYDAIVAADKQKTMSSLPPLPELPPLPKTVSAEPQPPEAPPLQGPDFYATHPDFYGHYNQSYENPTLLGPTQTLYSRYAKVELTEDQDASATKKYNITLNGLPLVLVDGQPSVIGVSRTYQLGDEDVMIFTSYRDNDPVCAYDYNLLILSADGTKARAIHNCTRGYQAKETNGMLFVTFPEGNDGRAGSVGATWRYDHGDLEKL